MNQTTARTVGFYFDYYSPYSYFVAESVRRLERDHAVVFDWHPVDIVSILKLDEADCYNPMKRAYIVPDVAHCAEYFDLPIAMPKPMPIISTKALSVSLLLKEQACFPRFALELFRSTWVRSEDISQSQVITENYIAVGGARELIEQALESWDLGQLNLATEQAMTDDIFGVPMLEFQGKKLFGSDRMTMLERWLSKSRVHG